MTAARRDRSNEARLAALSPVVIVVLLVGIITVGGVTIACLPACRPSF
jgi:hypothetical protein